MILSVYLNASSARGPSHRPWLKAGAKDDHISFIFLAVGYDAVLAELVDTFAVSVDECYIGSVNTSK